MRIAFVGIEKDWQDLGRRDYITEFVRYHLELPWYYAKYGNNVIIVSNYYSGPWKFHGNGRVNVITKEYFDDPKGNFMGNIPEKFDVVVHWRKWIEDCYRPEAINVINSQDHSYGIGWLKTVEKATEEKKLDGILCFPTWHESNLARELSTLTHKPPLLSGVTLGVDTDTYRPDQVKSRYDLLWASDIGRGLNGAMELALQLFQRDKRYKLHICWPDYTNGGIIIDHPALEFHKNLDNGPELWGLFNKCGWLPYTSTFKEPSSRAHRQAMAAGCVVLYPPDMGSPSFLTGYPNLVVSQPSTWVDYIHNMTQSEFEMISRHAREYAVSENWEVQAKRFKELFEEMINAKY